MECPIGWTGTSRVGIQRDFAPESVSGWTPSRDLAWS